LALISNEFDCGFRPGLEGAEDVSEFRGISNWLITKFDEQIAGLNVRDGGGAVVAEQACYKDPLNVWVFSIGNRGRGETHRVLNRFVRRPAGSFGLLNLPGFPDVVCFSDLLGMASPAFAHCLSADRDARAKKKKDEQ